MNNGPTQKPQTPQTPQLTQASARPAGPWANGWVPVWGEPVTFTQPTEAKASFTPARTSGRTHG